MVMRGWWTLTQEAAGPQTVRIMSSGELLLNSLVYGPSVPIQALSLGVWELTPRALNWRVLSSLSMWSEVRDWLVAPEDATLELEPGFAVYEAGAALVTMVVGAAAKAGGAVGLPQV